MSATPAVVTSGGATTTNTTAAVPPPPPIVAHCLRCDKQKNVSKQEQQHMVNIGSIKDVNNDSQQLVFEFYNNNKHHFVDAAVGGYASTSSLPPLLLFPRPCGSAMKRKPNSTTTDATMTTETTTGTNDGAAATSAVSGSSGNQLRFVCQPVSCTFVPRAFPFDYPKENTDNPQNYYCRLCGLYIVTVEIPPKVPKPANKDSKSDADEYKKRVHERSEHIKLLRKCREMNFCGHYKQHKHRDETLSTEFDLLVRKEAFFSMRREKTFKSKENVPDDGEVQGDVEQDPSPPKKKRGRGRPRKREPAPKPKTKEEERIQKAQVKKTYKDIVFLDVFDVLIHALYQSMKQISLTNLGQTDTPLCPRQRYDNDDNDPHNMPIDIERQVMRNISDRFMFATKTLLKFPFSNHELKQGRLFKDILSSNEPGYEYITQEMVQEQQEEYENFKNKEYPTMKVGMTTAGTITAETIEAAAADTAATNTDCVNDNNIDLEKYENPEQKPTNAYVKFKAVRMLDEIRMNWNELVDIFQETRRVSSSTCYCCLNYNMSWFEFQERIELLFCHKKKVMDFIKDPLAVWGFIFQPFKENDLRRAIRQSRIYILCDGQVVKDDYEYDRSLFKNSTSVDTIRDNDRKPNEIQCPDDGTAVNTAPTVPLAAEATMAAETGMDTRNGQQQDDEEANAIDRGSKGSNDDGSVASLS